MPSKREMEIMALNAAGFSAKEIGCKLFISPETVRKTFSNVKEKLGLSKTNELAAYFTCLKLGVDYDEFKKNIVMIIVIASIMGECNLSTFDIIRPKTRSYNRAIRRELIIQTKSI